MTLSLLPEIASATYFKQDKFNMNGVYLTASNSSLGYNLHKIKIMEEISLEHDPNFKCKVYPTHGDYQKVFLTHLHSSHCP